MTTTDVEHQSVGWTPDDSTFGARLALVRQRMKWGNVKEAAAACGLPTESWRSWERDGRLPRNVVEIADTISQCTGCDYAWLLTGRRLREGRILTTSGKQLESQGAQTKRISMLASKRPQLTGQGPHESTHPSLMRTGRKRPASTPTAPHRPMHAS